MKNYKWILFDADDTLFHFDAFSGLQLMFLSYNVQFTIDDYQEYQTVNKLLWTDYQNGNITSQQLQQQRFNTWANKLQVPAKNLNSDFMSAMAEICVPLDGVVNLLNSLHNKTKLGIITNGFTELQQIRLERTGLKKYFEILVISEQVGVAKPHPNIFEHAFSCMGNPDRKQVLMVGDNPESDILGGINAGIDTCWLNIHNKLLPDHITPLYQVSSLADLEKLLLNRHP